MGGNEENLKMRELEGPSETSRILSIHEGPQSSETQTMLLGGPQGEPPLPPGVKASLGRGEAGEAAEESQSLAQTWKLAVYSQLLRH